MWSGSLQSTTSPSRFVSNKPQLSIWLLWMYVSVCEWACVWCVYVAHISAPYGNNIEAAIQSVVNMSLCVSCAKVASIFAHLTYVEPYIHTCVGGLGGWTHNGGMLSYNVDVCGLCSCECCGSVYKMTLYAIMMCVGDANICAPSSGAQNSFFSVLCVRAPCRVMLRITRTLYTRKPYGVHKYSHFIYSQVTYDDAVDGAIHNVCVVWDFPCRCGANQETYNVRKIYVNGCDAPSESWCWLGEM